MDYHKEYAEQVESFVLVCHKLAQHMYVTGFGGNCAWKMDDDVLMITPTQMNKGAIRPKDVCFITMNGKKLAGERKPTGETPMYLNFFKERPDIQSVVHCHPPYTNAFAITKGKNWLMRPLFPEAITEVGPVPVVPYGEPLTQKLADAFTPLLPKYNAFLMENHGLVIMSRLGIEWTMMNTELLEMTSQHILSAMQLGADIKEIPKEDIQDMDNVMHTRDLPYMGAPGAYKSLVDVFFSES